MSRLMNSNHDVTPLRFKVFIIYIDRQIDALWLPSCRRGECTSRGVSISALLGAVPTAIPLAIVTQPVLAKANPRMRVHKVPQLSMY